MGIRLVPQTERIESRASFNFTISPDDRWMVFFEKVPVASTPEVGGLRPWLRVLDLQTGTLHEFELEADYQPPGAISAAAWFGDSRYCLLPSPPNRGRAVLIDVQDDSGPAISYGNVSRRNQDYALNVGDREIPLPRPLTCSDCAVVPDEPNFIREHTPEGHRGASNAAKEAVSVDGQYLFYQRSDRLDHRLTIIMRNVQTGEEREVASHTSRRISKPRVHASYLRPSPNGRWLAYQVTYSDGNWVDRGRLYLLDLVTGQRRRVAPEVFYEMHWTSDSSRLYFYQDPVGLHYLQVN